MNLTELAPGALSVLRQSHSRQDECVYILQGMPTLITDAGESGMCAGFKAGSGDSHHLHNYSDALVLYLELGDGS